MNTNYKTYLVFLGFTAFLWLAIQFSKNYTEEVTFKIDYKNNAIEKVLQPDSDSELTLQLEGSGVRLLKFYLLDNSLELDASMAEKLSETQLFFSGKKMIKALEQAIDYKGKIANPSKDTLFVHYDVLAEKKVTIKVKSNLKFQPGYQSLKGVQLDSVTVKIIGPNKVLESIDSVDTEELVLNELVTNQKGKLALDISDLPDEVKVNFKEVGYTLEVEKLTQGEFKVPILLVNTEKKDKVKVFPKEVNIIFKVSLKDFSIVKASDFEVQADFQKNRDAFLPLEITKYPPQVFDLRLEQSKVQFIFIQ